MALQELCPLFMFATVLCTVSCVKVLPIDGTTLTLAGGFNVKPSPVIPPEFMTDDTVTKQTIIPSKVATTFELQTKAPSLAKMYQAPALTTTEPTPKLAAVKELRFDVTSAVADAIAPTSVLKLSTLETFDVSNIDQLPPKIYS